MFENKNNSEELKRIAKNIVGWSIALSVIALVVGAISAIDADIPMIFFGTLLGCLVVIGSSVFNARLLYGFGELIENTESIKSIMLVKDLDNKDPDDTVNKLSDIVGKGSNEDKWKKFNAAGKITDEQYKRLVRLESLKNEKMITQQEYVKSASKILQGENSNG